MALKPKHPKAPWVTAYPEQARKLRPERKAKPLRSRSGRMTKRMKEYRRLKAEFLQQHPQCAVFPWQCEVHKFRAATQIHHSRGRVGSLLLDTRFWFGVSAEGHNWIHANPDKARSYGYLCARGQWNKPVPV